uniref:Uncharacterized protein n=1 Tax=Panagrellus redivivus TaxID=6233 RepID=A0A7E4V6U6_PANRE
MCIYDGFSAFSESTKEVPSAVKSEDNDKCRFCRLRSENSGIFPSGIVSSNLLEDSPVPSPPKPAECSQSAQTIARSSSALSLLSVLARADPTAKRARTSLVE